MQAKDYLKVCTSWEVPKFSYKEEVWDDGFHSGIDQILLTYSHGRVYSIQVVYYDSANNTSLAPKHGSDGITFKQISFKSESPIISVSGHYCSIGEVPLIRSIKFKTSSGENYGPYGCEIGLPFSYESDSKGLAGFHGKLHSNGKSEYLCYLGVYVQISTTKAAK